MSGNDSDDGENVVPVNKLEGGVYPTEAQTAAASVSEPKIYTVKAGDTIMGICKRYYGDTSKCSEVIAFNNIKDENLLYVGQQIKLP